MNINFHSNDTGTVPGKLADAEVLFSDGLFDGLKLVGFAVWERKGGGRTVTFPARTYSVGGERRSFSLLRPVVEITAHDRVRDAILDAYKVFETEVAAASQA